MQCFTFCGLSEVQIPQIIENIEKRKEKNGGSEANVALLRHFRLSATLTGKFSGGVYGDKKATV
jgi:hypothetical protein